MTREFPPAANSRDARRAVPSTRRPAPTWRRRAGAYGFRQRNWQHQGTRAWTSTPTRSTALLLQCTASDRWLQSLAVDFELLGSLADIETIAAGRGIRDLARLRRLYGKGYWRKMKGVARIRLGNGKTRLAEIHWYEAHGIGKKELKRKRYLD